MCGRGPWLQGPERDKVGPKCDKSSTCASLTAENSQVLHYEHAINRSSTPGTGTAGARLEATRAPDRMGTRARAERRGHRARSETGVRLAPRPRPPSSRMGRPPRVPGGTPVRPNVIHDAGWERGNVGK
jgi:hypothetical protein